MKETVIPKSSCPKCNRAMDRATSIRDDKAVPEPGSLSVYICCGAINKYGENLQLLGVATDELQKIKQLSPEAYRLLDHAQKIIKIKKSKGDWME